MRLHHAWKQMGVQEYNVGSGAFAMCNVQTSSKSKSTDKTMKNPSIFQSVEISRLSCHFRATFFFCVPVSSSLPLLFDKQCLVTRITSKVLPGREMQTLEVHW